MTQPTPSFLTDLRQGIVNTFSLDELITLCSDLGVDYENLGGQGKEAKARELVAYAVRHYELAPLVQYCTRKRPHYPWPVDPTLDTQAPPASSTASSLDRVPAQAFTDPTDTPMPTDRASLKRQLAELHENLRLIEERESQFVHKTDIPLQVVKEKRSTEAQIARLKQRIEQKVGENSAAPRQTAADTDTTQIEHQPQIYQKVARPGPSPLTDKSKEADGLMPVNTGEQQGTENKTHEGQTKKAQGPTGTASAGNKRPETLEWRPVLIAAMSAVAVIIAAIIGIRAAGEPIREAARFTATAEALHTVAALSVPPTYTPTPSATRTPPPPTTATWSPTPTPTASATNTYTPTAMSTFTPLPTLTRTVTSTPRPSSPFTPLPTLTRTATSTPRPSATFTPAPSHTPTMLSKPQAIIKDGNRVNLRSGPSTAYPVVGSAGAGDSFEIVGKNAETPTWWQVCCVLGRKVWVAAYLVTANGPLEMVQVMVVPPPPIPTPSLTSPPSPIPTDVPTSPPDTARPPTEAPTSEKQPTATKTPVSLPIATKTPVSLPTTAP